MAEAITPSTFEEAAAALAGAAAASRPVRFSGGGTKLGWGGAAPRRALRISTAALSRTLAHDPGDMTATFEAGAPLARVQQELAAHDQMLALDPPLGTAEQAATLGGIFATGDCGPLSHRCGSPRDQVLGMTVALSDGTLARTGGSVIKNVAGYDLARLFTGSFGTLGAILAISVRLRPLPERMVTAIAASDDPERLGRCGIALARAPLELEALDFAWRSGRGGLLARVAGVDATTRAERAAATMAAEGLDAVELTDEDEPLWERQRAGQRAADRAVVRIAGRPSELARLLRLADRCEAIAVGRVATGIAYLTVNVNQIAPLREGLPPHTYAVVLDLPVPARGAVDPWALADGPELALMRTVKARFDPAGVCNPGIFVGGI